MHIVRRGIRERRSDRKLLLEHHRMRQLAVVLLRHLRSHQVLVRAIVNKSLPRIAQISSQIERLVRLRDSRPSHPAPVSLLKRQSLRKVMVEVADRQDKQPRAEVTVSLYLRVKHLGLQFRYALLRGPPIRTAHREQRSRMTIEPSDSRRGSRQRERPVETGVVLCRAQ